MAEKVSFDSIDEFVKESEVTTFNENRRQFEYELNDKNIKSKLLKGAKRCQFEMVKNSGSINLIFNLGSWSKVVLPSIRYWDMNKNEKTCKVGASTVKISSLKTGTEAGGKHVDTQVVFFINREKAVCHFYNTTQLILVNGHGSSKLVQEFLVPYFKSLINKNIEEISKYNDEALQVLEQGVRRVKRGSVRYKAGSSFNCGRCEHVAGTLASLAKHSRNEHANSASSSLALHTPLHSTRNNSLSEAAPFPEIQMNENISINDLSIEESPINDKNEALKYTCLSCDYKTKTKSNMDKHVEATHGATVMEDNFVCGICKHAFIEKDDYNLHVKIHDKTNEGNKDKVTNDTDRDTEVKTNGTEVVLDDSGNDNSNTIPLVEENAHGVKPTENVANPDPVVQAEIDIDNAKLEDHLTTEHDRVIKCNMCTYTTDNDGKLGEHTEQKHVFKCEKCDVAFSTITILESHVKNHQEEANTCQGCNIIFMNVKEFKNHVCTHTLELSKRCNQCGYQGTEVKEIVNHILREHTQQVVGSYLCGFCSFETSDKKVFDEHLLEYHQMIAVVNGLARNQQYVSESFDQFKGEVTKLLKGINDELLETKQELFILRQKHILTSSSTQPQGVPAQPRQAGSQLNSPPADIGPSLQSLVVPPISAPPKAESPPPKPASKSSPNASLPTTMKPAHALFIGDSISENIKKDVIEKALGCEVRTAKAYAAIFDNVGGRAKKAARYPFKNFKDVVRKELEKGDIDYLLLQAGSADISNLNTKENPEENSTYLKEETRYAAKNLFVTAEDALKAQPGLKKVVVMTQIPRYDPKAEDPRALKQALAQLFNNTLGELWLDCVVKDKIVIGIHNLECSGGIREARYRDSIRQHYDGIHMYGPSGAKAYTTSVLDILSEANIIMESGEFISGSDFYKSFIQYEYQKRRNRRNNQNRHRDIHHMRSDSDNDRDIRPRRDSDNDRDVRPKRIFSHHDDRYTVPTSNRFAHLNW